MSSRGGKLAPDVNRYVRSSNGVCSLLAATPSCAKRHPRDPRSCLTLGIRTTKIERPPLQMKNRPLQWTIANFCHLQSSVREESEVTSRLRCRRHARSWMHADAICSYNVTPEELFDLFGKFGPIRYAIPRHPLLMCLEPGCFLPCFRGLCLSANECALLLT